MTERNTMTRTLLTAFFLASLAFSGLARDRDFSMAKVYPIDSGHSFIGFQVKYMGYAMVRGRFENFSGSVFYDPDDVTRTSATVVIKTESIDTDLAWRDKDLKSANWFDAENHPAIIFQTTRVEQRVERLFFYGDLTIRGVTKEVALEMHENSGILSDTRGDNQIILTGSAVVDRNDFGIKGERWSKVKEGIAAVAAEVEIELTVLGKQIKESNFRNWVRDASRPPGRIYKVMSESGIEAGLAEFTKMRSASKGKMDSRALNVAGQMLLKEGRLGDAIVVFERNVGFFPDQAGLFDSLAEACATAGQFKKAAENYRKVLELDPHNGNAIEVLRHIED